MNNVLVSRIKIMSGLNIAEKRLPQDGRFKKELELKTIDLRVSILPTRIWRKSGHAFVRYWKRYVRNWRNLAFPKKMK